MSVKIFLFLALFDVATPFGSFDGMIEGIVSLQESKRNSDRNKNNTNYPSSDKTEQELDL